VAMRQLQVFDAHPLFQPIFLEHISGGPESRVSCLLCPESSPPPFFFSLSGRLSLGMWSDTKIESTTERGTPGAELCNWGAASCSSDASCISSLSPKWNATFYVHVAESSMLKLLPLSSGRTDPEAKLFPDHFIWALLSFPETSSNPQVVPCLTFPGAYHAFLFCSVLAPQGGRRTLKICNTQLTLVSVIVSAL